MKNAKKPLVISVPTDQKVSMLKGIIDNLGGRRFGAVNEKKDFSLREWKGVSKTAVQNGGLKDCQVTVVEPNSRSQARTLDLSTVTVFRANGSVLQFV